MSENLTKVNCDFCGKEIECPKDMLEKVKKHMCYECFQDREENSDEELKDVHVDFPTNELINDSADRMVSEMVDSVFQNVWAERKEEMRDLSKKELAYEMFGAGAYIALSNFMQLIHQQQKEELKNPSKQASHENNS